MAEERFLKISKKDLEEFEDPATIQFSERDENKFILSSEAEKICHLPGSFFRRIEVNFEGGKERSILIHFWSEMNPILFEIERERKCL